MEKSNNTINYFAQTDFRGKKTTFGIKAEDRLRHFYVIGKTGMGKSTLLENMAIQDIRNGEGMAFLDPHGTTAKLLLDYIPKERIKDVIYFDPSDLDNPIGFNIMEDVGKDRRHLVVNGLMSAFKKIWEDAWSARMEYILNNTLLALLEYPGSTLLGVNRMLSDKNYRKKVVDNVTDPSVKAFWTDEFANYTERFAQEATPAIQNKIGQFTSNPLIRNIIGQPKSNIDFRKAMDERKIIIVNLSKGRIGEQNISLIGSMLVTKIYLAAMSRADVAPSELRNLPNFYCFVDEFQSFVNDSFADILSEARKYKLSLSIAHQYIDQMPDNVRSAVLGNVGTTVAFRVGPFDAEILEKVFLPTFTREDLVNLGFAQIYLTLSIDGVGSPPFSAVTLPRLVTLEESHASEVIAYTRQHYARPRAVVENEIISWYGDKNDSLIKTSEKVGVDNNAKQQSADFTKKREEKLVIDEIKSVRPAKHKSNEQKHLSLKMLKKNAGKDTSKHKEELRAILNDLIAKEKSSSTKKTINEIEEKSESIPIVEKTETVVKNSDSELKKEENKKTTKAEVAEEELRKILDI
jgi:hypothetical protein